MGGALRLERRWLYGVNAEQDANTTNDPLGGTLGVLNQNAKKATTDKHETNETHT